jgi:hypothetical protein
MLSLFGLIACMYFDAGFGWYLAGFICMLFDSEI